MHCRNKQAVWPKSGTGQQQLRLKQGTSNPTQGFKTHPAPHHVLIHPAPIFVSLPVPSSGTHTTRALTHANSYLLQNSENLALNTKFLQLYGKLSFTQQSSLKGQPKAPRRTNCQTGAFRMDAFPEASHPTKPARC